MASNARVAKAQLDEIMGTDAYQWLLGEIYKDADNVLHCLATEPDAANVKYRQGELYGMNLVAGFLREPWKRLEKAANVTAKT